MNMKKLFLFSILLVSIILFGDRVSFRLHQGIPLGDWAYDVNSGNDFQMLYLFDAGGVKIPAGVSLSSFNTFDYLYRINMASVHAGIQYSIYKSSAFSLFLYHLPSLSYIEKRYGAYEEGGFRETFDNGIGASYEVGEFALSFILNYKRIGLIEGADYISFAAAFDILSFRMFRR